MRRVGFVVHVGREEAVEAARTLAAWLRARGVASRSLPDERVAADEESGEPEFAEDLDLIVSVGGDGTLLRAAEIANRADAPVLGVKVGRVGFLTEVAPAEALDLLSDVLAGRARLEPRMAIEAAAPTGAAASPVPPQWALNEVIVEKRARHRLVTLAAVVDGQAVATFSADGVIVATPTGSTAYSFSARGPIVSPRLEALVLTPVSPHMVFDRSIVLAPDETVTLRVLADEPAILSADGRPGLELPVGASVAIRRSDRPARLVRRPDGPGFFTLLSDKFSLPGEAPHGRTLRDVGPGR